MPRLFVAIELPPAVQREAAHLGRGYQLPGFRWLPPEQLHLTLRFLGEVPVEHLPQLERSLATVHGVPFTLQLAGSGCFPHHGPAHVLWTGSTSPPELFALQRQVEQAVVACGLTAETRPFTPHITIARSKGVPPAALRPFLNATSTWHGTPFPVAAWQLFASELHPGGAVHRLLRSFPLTD